MKNKEVKEWIWSFHHPGPNSRYTPMEGSNYITPGHVKHKIDQMEQGEGTGKLGTILAIVGGVAVLVLVFVLAAL